MSTVFGNGITVLQGMALGSGLFSGIVLNETSVTSTF